MDCYCVHSLLTKGKGRVWGSTGILKKRADPAPLPNKHVNPR